MVRKKILYRNHLKLNVKEAIFRLTAYLGSLGAEYRKRDKIAILMYHEIRSSKDDIDSWLVVRKDDFTQQIDYLMENYRITSIRDALDLARKNTCLKKPMVVLTFDDGYSGIRRHLFDILESRQIPAAIFVATKQVEEQRVQWYDSLVSCLSAIDGFSIDLSHHGMGKYSCFAGISGEMRWSVIQSLLSDMKMVQLQKRESITAEILKSLGEKEKFQEKLQYMTPEDIHCMAASENVIFGAHSHCHNILTQIPPIEARESMFLSKQKLEEWTGKAIEYFSYPNGDYNGELAMFVEHLGFRAAFSTESSLFDGRGSFYHVPRVSVGRYDSMAKFKSRVSGLFL